MIKISVIILLYKFSIVNIKSHCHPKKKKNEINMIIDWLIIIIIIIIETFNYMSVIFIIKLFENK